MDERVIRATTPDGTTTREALTWLRSDDRLTSAELAVQYSDDWMIPLEHVSVRMRNEAEDPNEALSDLLEYLGASVSYSVQTSFLTWAIELPLQRSYDHFDAVALFHNHPATRWADPSFYVPFPWFMTKNSPGTDHSLPANEARHKTVAGGSRLVPDLMSSFEEYGIDVAINNGLAVVGGLHASVKGRVYLFEQDSTHAGSWSEVKSLRPLAVEENDLYGRSVALSGSTLAAGAPGDDRDGPNTGVVYLFHRDSVSGEWQEGQTLAPSDTHAHDTFGWSVALLEDGPLVIGAPGDDDRGSGSGAAYVFENQCLESTPCWSEVAKLTADHDGIYEGFGWSVAAAPQTIAVGAFNDSVADIRAGAAYLFFRQGDGSWPQEQRVCASQPQDLARFGFDLALTADRLLVGVPYEGADLRGAAYLFQRTGGAQPWQAEARLALQPTAETRYDTAGYAVSLEANALWIAAPWRGQIGNLADTGVVLGWRLSGGTWLPAPAVDGAAAYALDSNGGQVAAGDPNSSYSGTAWILGLLFADGFETGDTSFWSLTLP